MSIAVGEVAGNAAEAVREVEGDEKVGAGGNDKVGRVDVDIDEEDDEEDEEELVPGLEVGFEEAGAGSPASEDGFGSDI